MVSDKGATGYVSPRAGVRTAGSCVRRPVVAHARCPVRRGPRTTRLFRRLLSSSNLVMQLWMVTLTMADDAAPRSSAIGAS